MNDLFTLYSSKVNHYKQKVATTKKQQFFTSAARLLSFILFAVSIYLFLIYNSKIFTVTGFVMFVAFLIFVKRSSKLSDKKNLLEKLEFLNENELGIIEGDKNKFDNGKAFQSNERYYADLDIFGDGSLFHLINRTSTKHGYEILANTLKHPFTTTASITALQDAVKTYAPQHAVREQVVAKALINKEVEGDFKEINEWLQQPLLLLNSKWILIARYLLPALNLATLLISLYIGNYSLLTLTVLICWLHVGYFGKYIQQQSFLLGKKQQLLDLYATILKEFELVDYSTSIVLKQNVDLASAAHGAINKLSSLTNLLDQRLNLIVNILLNSFLLYDIQVMLELEKWKVTNKRNLEKWIECVATVELLTSFSTFAFNHPSYCFPTLIEDGLLIEAKELSHPLIKPTESVSNDISLGTSSKLLLITGSNMSGKTTFLRTVGINTLMAQCGLPVCAAAFSFTPVDIYTSIRISDSLQEHTSYFMAELKRLSEIKESIASQKPSLVLIDEILRGTNSDDKYYGSAAFVKQLINYNCLTLFATHDLKLSELEDEFPGVIENYCFESIIEGDELKFDYHILKGVAQNKNASFLMKKMEII
jgi:DNA mismatch repair ATPase MutS